MEKSPIKKLMKDMKEKEIIKNRKRSSHKGTRYFKTKKYFK